MAKSWFRTLTLSSVGFFCAVAAHAQSNLLFVTTQDDPTPPPGYTGSGGAQIIENARTAFQAQATAHGLTFVDRTNRLSNSAQPLASDIADASVLVLVTVYGPANSARMGEINAALASRPDLTVLAFVDGCCVVTDNINAFLRGVNTIKPWTTNVTSEYARTSLFAPLNADSLYRAPFQPSLSVIDGGWYGAMSNVPDDYRLYNAPSLPAAPTAPIAYGLIVPRAASNGGAGACLLMVSDATPFGRGTQPAQSNNIAAAFTTAGLDPAGACSLPAADAPDLAVALTGPATLVPDVPAAYTLTVSNPGVTASTATSVTVALPPGVTVSGPLPSDCTAGAGGTSVTCNVGALTAADPTATPAVAGGNVSFAIRLVAAPGAAGGNATATVPAQTGEVNTANNNTTMAIAVGAAPAAVPTLDVWALMALGGLLPLVASRRRRQH